MKIWPLLLLWVSLAQAGRAAIRLQGTDPLKPPPLTLKTRKLVDGYNFRNENFYDPRTADMRTFLEELRETGHARTNTAHLKTVLDPDSTATTGNASLMQRLPDLLPAFDEPIINSEVYQLARDYQLTLKARLACLNLDIFSEDPSVFLGERETYFLIIKKRGLLFYYLSRVVLYGLLVYLLVYLMMQDASRDKLEVDKMPIAPIGTKRRTWVQLTGLIIITTLSFGMLLYMDRPQTEIRESFSSLFYTFKTISDRVASTIRRNDNLNARRLQVPGKAGGRFVVQNRLSEGLALAQADLKKADIFLGMASNTMSISNNVVPITLSLASIGMLVLAEIGRRQRSVWAQMGIFAVSGLSLAYLLGSMDSFVVGFSSVNDVCLGILRYGQNPVLPFQGYGISSFLGSTVENLVFQQLYINTMVQNSALIVFNGELEAMGRAAVQTPSQAIKVTAYLRSLDSSSDVLEDYASILESNTQTLLDLLSLSGGNIIKEWVNEVQGRMCVGASRQIMLGFVVYIILCVVLASVTGLSLTLTWWFALLKHRKQAENYLLHADHIGNRFMTE